MPNKEPNPNRIQRQPTPDSPPPARQGERDAPGDTTDWTTAGHEEAEEQRRTGDEVGTTSGEAAGSSRPKPPRSG